MHKSLALLLAICLLPSGRAASEDMGPLATVQGLFDAMSKHDADRARELFLPEAALFSVRADGTAVATPHEKWVGQMGASKDSWQEQISNPKVLEHGGIAVVWGEYDFRLNGKISHCGVDSFNLLKNGDWLEDSGYFRYSRNLRVFALAAFLRGHSSLLPFDVAIIGSGPAGCALAIRLRKAGVSAVIITVPRRFVSGEIPETVPPGAFEKEIFPAGSTSLRPHYAMVSAWGHSKLTTRHAICNPLGHGWFVDRADFDREILTAATAEGAVSIIHSRIRSVSRTPNGWALCLPGQPPAQADVVTAGIVVDASGRSSAFARMMGIRRIALDRLVCLSARAVPSDFPAGEALVESVEAGWWFSALNPSGNLSISFFTDPRGALFEDALRATIHTSARISHLLPGRPVSRAARTDWLEAPAGEGWLAVGDAAFASDPLGSQGLLRAFEMAEKAAAIILSNSAYNSNGVRQYCEIQVYYLDRFLRDRKRFYGAERRWPDAPFWRSAHAAMDELPGSRANFKI